MDLAVLQSWLIYVQDCKHEGNTKQLPLLKFKLEIADCLLKRGKISIVSPSRKRGRQTHPIETELQAKQKKGPTAAVPLFPVRTDNVGHFPLPVDKKGRCKFPGCKGFSRTVCEKCLVSLCLTQKSNCFRKFHMP